MLRTPEVLLVGVALLVRATFSSASRKTKALTREASTDEDSTAVILLKIDAPMGEDKEERLGILLEGLGAIKGLLPQSNRQSLRNRLKGLTTAKKAFSKLGLDSKLPQDFADWKKEAVVDYFASDNFKVWSDQVLMYKNNHIMGIYLHLKTIFKKEGLAVLIEMSDPSIWSVAGARGKTLQTFQFKRWFNGKKFDGAGLRDFLSPLQSSHGSVVDRIVSKYTKYRNRKLDKLLSK